MARRSKFTDKQIEKALRNSGGMVTHAANLLGITYDTLYKRCRKKPEKWAAIRASIMEHSLDDVESKLFEKAKAGHTAELIFYLKCQGKNRGYIEKQEMAISQSFDNRANKEITADTPPVEASKIYSELIRGDKE